jgi:hypothetical protein
VPSDVAAALDLLDAAPATMSPGIGTLLDLE